MIFQEEIILETIADMGLFFFLFFIIDLDSCLLKESIVVTLGFGKLS